MPYPSLGGMGAKLTKSLFSTLAVPKCEPSDTVWRICLEPGHCRERASHTKKEWIP
jgi:hypothetical protein